MNKIKLKAIAFFVVFIIPTLLFSQKKPMRFGKVDIKDLKMTVYDKDTTAEAVVLYDIGDFDPLQFRFARHCRIKILKKGGTGYGNIRIRVPKDFSSIRARTYNLENGEIIESKMKRESIFKETIEGEVSAIRMSLPNVKVGSVIEYEYVMEWVPYEWRFQQEIPVQWSELRFSQHDNLIVQKNFYGYEPIDVIEPGKWIAKDVPAFRKEPYMSSIHNYITKFEFEIEKIFFPKYGYVKEFIKTWDNVAKTLTKHSFFGGKLSGNLALNKYVEEIESKAETDFDKLKEAYDFIRKEITWDERSTISSYNTFMKVCNDKRGTSGDINLMLISMLRKMDIKADPVVLSTRSNGVITPICPSMNKLNYVIAKVVIGEKEYLVDATDKHAPLGLLPYRCINGQALIVEEYKGKTINIKADKSEEEVHQANLQLNEEGTLIGKINYILKDYAAYDFRKELDEYPSQDKYIEELQEAHNGLIIENYQYKDIEDVYKPVNVQYDIELEDNVDIIADNIYVNPMLLDKLTDNPFKTEERKYPVDFIHPINKRYILNFKIPEGYTVEQLPEPQKVSLPEGKGSYTYHVIATQSFIQLKFYLEIKDPVILSTEYGMLKGFYDMLINKQSEMIILKHI